MRCRRSDGHRAHRSAARPRGAAVWRQRGGRRGQRDRQPHPARADRGRRRARPTWPGQRQPREAAAACCSKAATAASRYTPTLSSRTPTTCGCPPRWRARKPVAAPSASRICNSASRGDGGAVGGTLFFDQGYLGASASTYRSDYGTVAEDDVTIDMQLQPLCARGRMARPRRLLHRRHGKFSHTDYRHTEFEGPRPAPSSPTRATTSGWRRGTRKLAAASKA